MLLATACFGVLEIAPASASPATVVATVGSTSIVQEELDRRAAEMEQAYRERQPRELTDAQRLSIRRQALETLVRQRLYRLEAERTKVPVSESDIEVYLKRIPVFNPGGTFSQRAYDNAKRNDPATFRRAGDEIRRDLGAQKFSEDLRRRFTPSDEALRRAAQRELTTADLQVLAVPRGPISGRYREPTEKEVVEEYRAHVREFERPAEAIVRAVQLDAGAADRDDRSRLRQRADSVVAALRAGMALSEAADRFGGSARRLNLRDDNLPGSWKGSQDLTARIFHSRPATLIEQPVPSATGFYVVVVDSAGPRRTATLAEVAEIIRKQLRLEARERVEARDLQRFYEASRDSLSRPGYRVRCAVVEGSSMKLGAPTEDDLAGFYQSRLAEFSRFDPVSQSLVVTPFEQVRGQLVDRWKASRRDLMARDLANRIEESWSRGRRDRAVESQAKLYELGAVPYGGQLDVGPAGNAVSDSMRNRVYDRMVQIVPIPGGYAVVHAYDLVEKVSPSLEQIRAPLLEQLEIRQDAAERQRARQLYEQDPQRFLTGNLVYYSTLWCPQPELIDVPLTRQELETYYREHITEYASPERFRVRQILVRSTSLDDDADRAARTRAEELLRRIRSGEDMAEMARRLSDDDKSRDDGGDLGYKAAGELAPELQKAAFALKVGQVSGVVRSTDGYHILQVTEHVAERAEPLAWVYTSVGADAALKKAQNMARHQADSLAQVLRDPDQARAAAARLKLEVLQYRHRPGNRDYPEERLRMYERLERMKPGEMYPGSEFFLGIGAGVMWVDSVAPARIPDWDQAIQPVLDEYRRRLSRDAATAKQAELDSLLRVGWSFDSVGAAWGGLRRDEHYTRHEYVAGVGVHDAIDSLAFGTPKSPPLPLKTLSGWLDLTDVLARVRIEGRHEPSATEVERQIGQDRGLVLEYRMQDEVKAMKQRFPVRVVDPRLRDVKLPPLPPMPEL
jgi:parvulin-like peptidyl-prolyl isomerase